MNNNRIQWKQIVDNYKEKVIFEGKVFSITRKSEE